MTVGWTEAAVILALAASASAGFCFAALRRFQRSCVERERGLEEQVSTLEDAVQTLERMLLELHPSWRSAVPAEADSAAGEDASNPQTDEVINPEIQAAIVAAAVTVLGRNVRLRSARLIRPREDVSAWSHQGRVLVHTSHNLRLRR